MGKKNKKPISKEESAQLINQFEKKLNQDASKMSSYQEEGLRIIIENARQNNPTAHAEAAEFVKKLKEQASSAGTPESFGHFGIDQSDRGSKRGTSGEGSGRLAVELQRAARSEDVPDYIQVKISLLVTMLTQPGVASAGKKKPKKEVVELMNQIKVFAAPRTDTPFGQAFQKLFEALGLVK